MTVKTAASPRASHAEDDTLSALLDGELPHTESQHIIARMHGAPAETARFCTYSLIGDSLRGLPETHPDFTANVMAALKNEPTLLAPMPRKRDRRPALWLAAAAVSAITWGLWQSLPDQAINAPMAASTPRTLDVEPYLAAHQDFAQAVIAPAEMQFTQVSFVEPQR